MPGFEKFYKRIKNRYPIFFNFFGLSQINIAFNAYDYESFYKLIDIMLVY